ncbi:MAG: DUF58 domain-containing protein [Clostridiales bacterium]|nr:DUF58 domain-containing protein [Clostridiales bacterium]
MAGNRNSVFVSLPGIGILFVLAVTAIYFQVYVIAVFLAVLTLLGIVSRLWSGRILKRVEVHVRGTASAGHVGDLLRLEVKVRNKSFLPLIWMDVLLPAGTRPVVRQKGEKEDFRFARNEAEKPQIGLRERLVWLWWQQEISWEEELCALRRGSLEIGGVLLQAGDGFGMSALTSWREFAAPVRLTVYPEIVPVRPQPFLRITQEAVTGGRGQTEDITVLKNSRDYLPGDPMKRINWRLLASSGRMEVNVYETITPGCVTFVLDLESFRNLAVHRNSDGTMQISTFLKERELEEMISLVASCLCAVRERGIPTALLIPGYGSREALFCLPDEEGDLLSAYMNALAMIDYQAEAQTFPYEEFWQISHRLGNLYLCVRTDEGSSLEALAEGLGRSRAHVISWERVQSQMGEYDCYYAEDLLMERPAMENVPEETLVDTRIETGGKDKWKDGETAS